VIPPYRKDDGKAGSRKNGGNRENGKPIKHIDEILFGL
jgi:hypothetical protein